MKRFAFSLFILMSLNICSGYAHAQDISVEATVDAKKVALGSGFQLILAVNGTQDIDPIDLPDIDGFDAQYLGPSTRVSIVNGQYSASKNFIYLMYPQKTGTFQIPALSLTISGKTYITEPIDIEVVSQQAAPRNAAPQDPRINGEKLSDRIFLIMGTPVNQAYVGEKIPLTIQLFINNLDVRDVQFPEFEHSGFTVDDFAQPRQYQDIVRGVRYNVVEFKAFVYPNRSGDLLLGPGKLSCNLLFKNIQKRGAFGGGGFGSFFDDSFFNGFFDSYQKRPVTLESADLAIKVRPLPDAGKPDNFSGGVGLFDLDASAGPDKVKAGDPVTLRVKVWGTGNLKAVQMPSFKESPDFKVYEPQIKEEGGNKILEQVVIPKSENVTEIPAIRFSYFNPDKNEYVTLRKGPFPVAVSKPAPGEEFKVVGLDAKEKSYVAEELGRDVVFIKENPGTFRPKGAFVYRRAGFRVLVVLVLLGWAGLVGFYKRTHKLQTDTAYARRLRAPGKARKGLAQAAHFLKAGKQREFYDAIFKVLLEYFADKFHLAAGGMTASTIEKILKERNVDPNVLGKIRSVFEECDMVRFASAQMDEAKRRSSYEATEYVIDYLERRRV